MVWLPALEVHETRQRHSLLWHVLSAQDWWMFLGHEGPTEGNMFGFCVSTVWAKILQLNAVFKDFRDQVCGLFQGFCCRGGITGPEEGLHLYVGGGLPLNTIQIVLIDLAFTCLCIPQGRKRMALWDQTPSVSSLQTISCACSMGSWHVKSLNLISPK